jgi:hypothetical protein
MVMLDRFEKLFCSACLFCVTVTPQALFAETASWHYKVTPYLWNVGFEGNTSSGGNDIPIDTDYSFFTLDNLDKVFSIAFEASNGRLGILFDGLRASYSDNTSNVLFATQLSVKLGFIEGAVSYMPAKFSHLDFIGGARYIFVDTQLVFTPGPASETTHDWLDPLFGVRYKNSLAGNWHYQLRGDIGGFGVSSELVVNLLATIGYKFNNTLGVDLGYRYVDIDFTEDDFIYDVSMQGIVVGLGIHF